MKRILLAAFVFAFGLSALAQEIDREAVATAEAWRPEGGVADTNGAVPAMTPSVSGAVRDLIIVS